ncbi:hypothetical protein ABE10_10615 [Bacillus toyonensis]|nr:hypothetical protein [Bacillus toyonensis]
MVKRRQIAISTLVASLALITSSLTPAYASASDQADAAANAVDEAAPVALVATAVAPAREGLRASFSEGGTVSLPKDAAGSVTFAAADGQKETSHDRIH